MPYHANPMLSDRDYMQEKGPSGSGGGFKLSPPQTAVGWILVVNVVVFLLQQFEVGFSFVQIAGRRVPSLGFASGDLSFEQFWTLFTHQFVHYNLLHLVANLFLLVVAGRRVESALGSRALVFIYLLGGVVGALTYAGTEALVSEEYYLVGASGSAFAMLVAYAMIAPLDNPLPFLYYIIPVQIKTKTLAIILTSLALAGGVLSLLFTLSERSGSTLVRDVAHFAHVGGAAAGFVYMLCLGFGTTPMNLSRMKHDRRKREGMTRKDLPTNASPSKKKKKKPFVSAEIDAILDKINEHGFHSLTDEEKEALDNAQGELKKRDRRL